MVKAFIKGKCLAKFDVNGKEVAMIQQGDTQPVQIKNVNGNCEPGEEVELYCKFSVNPGSFGKPPSMEIYCLET